MKTRYKVIALICILMLVFTLTACTGAEDQKAAQGNKTDETKNDDKDQVVVIKGLDESREISVAQLKNMETVTKKVVSVNSNGEEKEFEVTGVLFEKVLEQLGSSKGEFTSVRFTAGDGYSIEVPEEILKNREIILAYEMNGEPLDEQTKPVRIIIPEERAMYWVKNVKNIEVVKSKQNVKITKIYIMETAVKDLKQYDYDYYNSKDKAVKGEDIIKTYESTESNSVFLKASDGLEKSEKVATFAKAFIKYTGEDAPSFVSPELPKGMHIKNLLWFLTGETGFFSVQEALDSMEQKEVQDIKGVSIKEIFMETGLIKADIYKFTARDGYEVEIEAKDIEKGIIYIREKGNAAVKFDGLPKNTGVKDILVIEAVK